VARERLADEDVARLRRLHERGWTLADLAAEFGISRQHAGRLVRGEQRASIAGLDAEAVRGDGVAAAVGAFLADVAEHLSGSDAVFAATARTLAHKIDACAATDAVAAAQALPRLCGQLVDVLERLQAVVPREPDGIDRLRQQYLARQLAYAARNGETVKGDIEYE
jgi:transcriptional regulator with XRE-family HTH domain